MVKFFILTLVACIVAVPQPISISPVVYKSVVLQAYPLDSEISYGGGLQTSYTSFPAYGSSSEGQSDTQGGQINQYSNSQSSGSSVIGNFNNKGVSGNQYQNFQVSSGGSSTSSNSANSQSYVDGSSFTKQPQAYSVHY